MWRDSTEVEGALHIQVFLLPGDPCSNPAEGAFNLINSKNVSFLYWEKSLPSQGEIKVELESHYLLQRVTSDMVYSFLETFRHEMITQH